MAPFAPHVDLDQRVHGAQSLAAGAGDRGAAPGAVVLPRPDDGQDVGLRQLLLEGLEHLAAARRHAAGAQADADVDLGDGQARALPGAGLTRVRSAVLIRALLSLGRRLGARGPPPSPSPLRSQFGGPELLDHVHRLVGRQLAVGPVVDHDHRRHAAGAHAVHLFDA